MSNVKIEIREKEMKLREVQEEIRLKEQESERLKKEIQLLSNELIDDSENHNKDFDEPPFPDGFWNIPPLVEDESELIEDYELENSFSHYIYSWRDILFNK